MTSKRNALREIAGKLLGKNGETKMLAVAVAALSIYAIGNAIGYTRTFTVPVHVTCDDTHTSVVDVEPATVTIKLRGDEKSIDALDVAQLSASVRVSDRAENEIPTKRLRIANLGKLRCVGIAEETIKIEYDFTASWTVTNYFVSPKLVGTPEQAVATAEFFPAEQGVTVKGSNKKLGEFRKKGLLLPLAPIDVEGKIENFEIETPIQIPADSGIESVTPDKVKVLVKISTINSSAIETPEPVIISETPAAEQPDEDEATADGAAEPAAETEETDDAE